MAFHRIMGLRRSQMARVLVVLFWFFQIESVLAQSGAGSSTRALDVLLQDYAFRAFIRPKTGIAYDGIVPSNLTGIGISAMRLRRGSLRRRGVEGYREFNISTGVDVSPSVERLVLVYQNLGNWSLAYYRLPGYTYLTPVVGLLAYNASNLSATNLPELDFNARADPITIRFANAALPPMGLAAKCISIDSLGSVNMRDPISNNQCSSTKTGHFAIAFESISPSPAMASPISPRPRVPQKGKKGNSRKLWIIIISVAGGLALLMLLVTLAMWVGRSKGRKEAERMEKAAETKEQLYMKSVGDTKAPVASVTRTQPVLESEYAP